MNLISVGVFSNDKEYSLALAQAVSALENRFFVTVLKKDEVHKERLAQFDLIFWDDCGFLDCPLEERAVLLSSHKGSSMTNLCRQALLKYGEITGKSVLPLAGRKAGLLCVGSCSGGAGATTVSLGIAQELVRFHGKKVLYLSFDELGDEISDCGKGERGLEEYLYLLDREAEGGPLSQLFVLEDAFGVAFFQNSPGRNCLKQLDEKELNRFVTSLIREDYWDFLIFDLGKDLSQEAVWIYGNCDRVIIVTQPGSAPAKEEKMKKYLSFHLSKEQMDKIAQVLNKYKYEEEPPEELLKIDWDEESVKVAEGKLMVDIDKDFGIGIKDLASKLM